MPGPKWRTPARRKRYYKKWRSNPFVAERIRTNARNRRNKRRENPALAAADRRKIKEYFIRLRKDPTRYQRHLTAKRKYNKKWFSQAENKKRRRGHHQRWANSKADELDCPAVRKMLATMSSTTRNKHIDATVGAIILERMRKELKLPRGNWKYIPGTDKRYCVSITGEVRNCNSRGVWVASSAYLSGGRYLQVDAFVAHACGRRHFRIHQLVLSLFGPPRPSPKHVVCHVNDDKVDNRLCNLYWGTIRENNLDAIKNRRRPNILSPETARDIFTSSGYDSDIAIKYNVPLHTVYGIRNGRTFADFTRGCVRGNALKRSACCRHPRMRYKLTDTQVSTIRQLARSGYSYRKLGRLFNVSGHCVRSAAIGSSYPWVNTPFVEYLPMHLKIKHLPRPLTDSPIEYGKLYDPEHRDPAVRRYRTRRPK